MTRRSVIELGAGLTAGGLAAGGLLGCASADPTRAAGTSAPEEAGELDELFADLTDESGSVEPISAAERAERRERVAGFAAEAGVDALVCEAGATMTYLSGVRWGHSERLFALVLLADGSSFWLAPAFEVPRARGRLEAAGLVDAEVVGWDEHEYAFEPLAAALRERDVQRVVVDPRLRFFAYDGLAQAFGRDRVSSGLELVRRARGTKDEHELALMRRACELTQQAIVVVSERLEPGLTGPQIGARIRRAQERLGLRDTWVLPLVGPEAAFPHGKGGTTPIERGSVILVDTGGSLHDYQSDITRTWTFGGTVTVEVERVWNTVRDAQLTAFEAIRPGIACRAIDAVARGVIAGAGYGGDYESFFHRLGHGIGLEGHEEPYLDGGNELLLAPGMTFSDEPGIYLYDRFGVRIEDIIAVNADGAEAFGSWQRSVLSPAG